MLKKTALNAVHHQMGAKMVDFGGWEMPLHYGSQIDEHHKVRHDVGMFDVSHMLVVDIKGKEAREFLRYLLANNVDKLVRPGQALYSCMLNEEGGVVDDLIAYYMNTAWFRLVVNAGTADKDVAWMHQHNERNVEIKPRRDLAMIAVQGPNAEKKLCQALPDLPASGLAALTSFNAWECAPYFIARTGYTGEDGFEMMLPAEQAPPHWLALHQVGISPIGLGARDTLRLEAGMNLYGQDMNEQTSPLEAGLAWTVDMKSPRLFVGKSALGAKALKYNLLGLVLLDRGVLRAHQKVQTLAGLGEITSGGFSPTLNRSIALAKLPKEIQPQQTVQVLVRDKPLAARVVKYPFVRRGKALVEINSPTESL